MFLEFVGFMNIKYKLMIVKKNGLDNLVRDMDRLNINILGMSDDGRTGTGSINTTNQQV